MIKSALTNDMNTCYITGLTGHIERHHVFGGAYRTRSTFYGFVVPLLAEIHPNGAWASDKACKDFCGATLKQLDLHLKKECQRLYEGLPGKTRKSFIEEFGKNYLEKG